MSVQFMVVPNDDFDYGISLFDSSYEARANIESMIARQEMDVDCYAMYRIEKQAVAEPCYETHWSNFPRKGYNNEAD